MIYAENFTRENAEKTIDVLWCEEYDDGYVANSIEFNLQIISLDCDLTMEKKIIMFEFCSSYGAVVSWMLNNARTMTVATKTKTKN